MNVGFLGLNSFTFTNLSSSPMSSPCVSGPYLLDVEIVKSARTSLTSSPSFTLSESSNSPLVISSTKPRASRKRRNQTYNEAAALLSTAYPAVFSVKQFANQRFHKAAGNVMTCESQDLLLPFGGFDDSVFAVHLPAKEPEVGFFKRLDSPREKHSCQSSCSTTTTSANTWEADSMEVCGREAYDDADFDAESILDEEVEEGIDSILGNLSVSSEKPVETAKTVASSWDSWCPGPIGLSLGGRNQFGMKTAVAKALRSKNHGNFLNSSFVDMIEISPKLAPGKTSDSTNRTPKPSKTKKKKKGGKATQDISKQESGGSSSQKLRSELGLKLNYDSVLIDWATRGMPFPDDAPGAEGTDVAARLEQIDLFTENGVLREASVLRYKEKRRTRLFSKKIRYQVRKVNADQRPRMKGRFVRRPNINAIQTRNKQPISC